MRSLPVIQGRKCGECTACCNVLSVQELGKPYYIDCEHLKCDGCSIYESRPPTCRDYQCMWLEVADLIDDGDRPDKLGVLFQLEVDHNGIWIEVFEIRHLDEASRKKITKITLRLLDRLSPRIKFRGAKVYPYNSIVGTLYPLNIEKYPDCGEGGTDRGYGSHDDKLYTFVGSKRDEQQPTAETPE